MQATRLRILRAPTSVFFIGISGSDYGDVQKRSRFDVDAYTNSGNALSIAANRISFPFDFRGPSFAVDTACSSSPGGARPGVPGAVAWRRSRRDCRRREFAVHAGSDHRLQQGFHAFTGRTVQAVRRGGQWVCARRGRCGYASCARSTRPLHNGDRIYAIIQGDVREPGRAGPAA